MPRFEKGSQAAKDWAAKMKKARQEKKGLKGGTITNSVENMQAQKVRLQNKHTSELNAAQQELNEINRIADLAESSVLLNPQIAPIVMKKQRGGIPYKKPTTTVIYPNGTTGKGMAGGYLQPGEVPMSSGTIEEVGDNYAVLPDDAIDGTGMCRCDCCEMCGGKIMSPSDFRKSFTRGISKVSEGLNKINPVSVGLKHKKTRDRMIQSGKFTNEVALPAVTTAGMPLYYGTAGTAGLLLGGPMGSVASTKAADLLWQEMVAKKGYDPQKRQTNKTVGVVSKKVGELGAAKYKTGVSGKGINPVVQALAVVLGVPVTVVTALYTYDQARQLLNRLRERNQVVPMPIPQQGEFKEEMPDDMV